eukprot:2131558-Prymnesium_polylepis.1
MGTGARAHAGAVPPPRSRPPRACVPGLFSPCPGHVAASKRARVPCCARAADLALIEENTGKAVSRASGQNFRRLSKKARGPQSVAVSGEGD